MNLNKNGELSVLLQRLTDKYGRAWPRLVPDGHDGGPIDPDLAKIWQITGTKLPKQRRKIFDHRKVNEAISILYREINNFPSLTAIQKKTGISENTMMTAFAEIPELERQFYANQRRYYQVKVGDELENRVYQFETMNQARIWLGITQYQLNIFLSDEYRHQKALIKARYQVKRRLWYDVDGGFE